MPPVIRTVALGVDRRDSAPRSRPSSPRTSARHQRLPLAQGELGLLGAEGERARSAASRPPCRRCRSGRSGRGARTGRSARGPRSRRRRVGASPSLRCDRALGEDRQALGGLWLCRRGKRWSSARARGGGAAGGLGVLPGGLGAPGLCLGRTASSASGSSASLHSISSSPSGLCERQPSARLADRAGAQRADPGQGGAAASAMRRGRSPLLSGAEATPAARSAPPPCSGDLAPGEGQPDARWSSPPCSSGAEHRCVQGRVEQRRVDREAARFLAAAPRPGRPRRRSPRRPSRRR